MVLRSPFPHQCNFGGKRWGVLERSFADQPTRRNLKKAAAHPHSPKYTEELHKLQVAKAKLVEAQDSLAALEEAVTYEVVAYGEDSSVTDILIRHALDRRQSVEKMEMEIAKTTKVTSKEFALHDDPFVKGLDEALQSFKMQRQQYFGGVFVGNHIHKTLII
eukprot:Em0001g1748a